MSSQRIQQIKTNGQKLNGQLSEADSKSQFLSAVKCRGEFSWGILTEIGKIINMNYLTQCLLCNR